MIPHGQNVWFKSGLIDTHCGEFRAKYKLTNCFGD